MQTGFVRANWCGDRACEERIKAECNATTRCMPLGASDVAEGAVCGHCGKPAKTRVYFAKSY